MKLAKRPEITAFLNNPDPSVRGILIYGRDRGQVRERALALAAKVVRDPNDPFDVAILTDSDIDQDPTRLTGELEAQSMMGGRRLVRLKLSADKPASDKAVAEAVKAHAEGQLNPEAFFLIEASALGGDSALRKAAEASKTFAALACYEDEAGDVGRMAREALSAEGLSLTHDALDLFVSRLPRERGVARQEIERLILFLGPGNPRTATPHDLEPFLGVEPEASLFDAASDAFGGRMKQAQAALQRAFAEGESGPAAVRAVTFHMGRLRRILTLIATGTGPKEAAKAAGVFWKQEQEVLRQVRSWSLEDLTALAAEVVEADRLTKRTGMPDHLIAERLIMTVAGRARRLGL